MSSYKSPVSSVEELEQRMATLAKTEEEFSGVVLAALGDEIIFKQAYGLANIEWDIPNTTDTVFHILAASVRLAGAVALKLSEDGVLDVDAPLKAYIPQIPDTWSAITVHYLLNGTSGVPDYIEMPDDTDTLPQAIQRFVTSEASLDELLESIYAQPLKFEPGTDTSPTLGFAEGHLKVKLLEAATGKPYAQVMQDTLFTPLGMHSTTVGDNHSVIPRRASGYVDRKTRARDVNMNLMHGSTAVLSTVEDLYKFERAYHTGKFVKQATYDEMWRRAFPARDYLYGTDDVVSLGYGIARRPFNGVQVTPVSGTLGGFSSFMSYLPEHDAPFCLLANRQNTAVRKAMFWVAECLVAVSNQRNTNAPR